MRRRSPRGDPPRPGARPRLPRLSRVWQSRFRDRGGPGRRAPPRGGGAVTDPRPSAVARRLAGVKDVLAVGGGKGGIGKSLTAAGLALAGAREGARTGLLDLDLTAPSAPVILGARPRFPDEAFGIEPVGAAGIRLMSAGLLSGARPAPLRGAERTEALLELLAITNWGELDTLLLDLPPGLGDEMLDLVRFLPRTRFLVLTTASPIVRATVHRQLDLLRRVRTRVAGLVLNMRREGGEEAAARELAEATGARWLGALAWDPAVEAAVGNPGALAETRFFADVRALWRRLRSKGAGPPPPPAPG
ncbi:MAG: ATP-binding protein [Acidobacteria bacterium]|nr:MAG: ATP-binding protein [Acidobacteriota bacterium]